MLSCTCVVAVLSWVLPYCSPQIREYPNITLILVHTCCHDILSLVTMPKIKLKIKKMSFIYIWFKIYAFKTNFCLIQLFPYFLRSTQMIITKKLSVFMTWPYDMVLWHKSVLGTMTSTIFVALWDVDLIMLLSNIFWHDCVS